MMRRLARLCQRYRGFTLIELLVVIAIIAVLIALLVPAVQKVREAAARIKCGNNLKNLGVACHAYHDVNGSLPAAIQMWYAQQGNSNLDCNIEDTRFGPNWVCLILPYIEQGNIYNQWQVNTYTAAAGWSQTWRGVRNTQIKVMQCPSNYSGQATYSESQGGNWERGNYACNAGPGWWYNTVQGQGDWTWIQDNTWWKTGPVMGINYGATLTELTNEDGTAYTVMLEELRIGVEQRDCRGTWALGFPGASVCSANAQGDCPYPNDYFEGSDDVMHCDQFYYWGIGNTDGIGCWTGCWSWQGGARSKHPQGVNCCFADGSVRFVRSNPGEQNFQQDYNSGTINDVSQRVWLFMLSRNDGQTYTYNW